MPCNVRPSKPVDATATARWQRR